ncbi:MAG: hypothetical protein K8T89_17635 [Planctomycetes bacterium]|nr:hypothetical protein [Planctomycetota bacterium]
MIRALMSSFVAACLVLVLVGPLAAKEREVWRHPDGFFENNKGNDWYEKSPNGKFQFKEIKRTAEFIELENIKSGNRVRLLNDRCIQVDKDGNETKEYYKGKWEE